MGLLHVYAESLELEISHLKLQTPSVKLTKSNSNGRCAMKVASFNVNSIRARLPVVIPWLQKSRPDVLAMQETKVQDEDFPKAAFEEIDYSCVFRGQKSYNGVALATRGESTDV
jgi:hypothetical protein